MRQFFSLKAYAVFLSRNKLFTAISIFGFSTSLMFVILFGLYVHQELSVDSWHTKRDRIYRLAHDKAANWAAPIAGDIAERYSEIEQTVRMFDGKFAFIAKEQEYRAMVDAIFLDSNFFSVFDFRLIEGDPKTALAVPTNVLLSQSFARTVFGEQSPIGKSVSVMNKDMVVSGVIEDFKNTSLRRSDIILPFKSVSTLLGQPIDTYHSCNYTTFILTSPNADIHAKADDMTEYFKKDFWLFKRGYANNVKFEPLHDVHFTIVDYNPAITTNDKGFISILITTTLLILLFAVINYINLSVAQSSFRAKEAATRRLLGGTKAQLFANFITESVLLCMVSIFIAFLFTMLVEPIFNNVMDYQSSVSDSLTLSNVTIALGSALILGVISGLFPALIISRFKPIEVVRGNFKRRTKMVYSKVLISFQYLITIVMIGCAMVIIRQIHFMKSADLGFERENTLQIENYMEDKVWGVKDILLSIPGVTDVSLIEGSPIDGGNNHSMDIDGVNYSFQCFGGDSSMMQMLDLEVVKLTGNNVDSAVYINETAWRKLGLKDGDSEFKYYGKALAVRGVVKDFHFRDMSMQIDECVIFPIAKGTTNLSGYETEPWSILVKISGDNPAEVRKRVEKAVIDFSGGIPVNCSFWDDEVERWYVSQQRISDIVGVLSLLALILSSLGILAMSTYFIRQRTKEIAIRKVFGSTSIEMLVRLIKSFLMLVAVAFIIAVPIIWYIMSEWLKDYQYRIDITWDIMLIAGLITFVVAFITVVSQSIIATYANPVKSLKD